MNVRVALIHIRADRKANKNMEIFPKSKSSKLYNKSQLSLYENNIKTLKFCLTVNFPTFKFIGCTVIVMEQFNNMLFRPNSFYSTIGMKYLMQQFFICFAMRTKLVSNMSKNCT